MLIDEDPQDLKRRSSSAWAKNVLDTLRISLARRSSLPPHSNALMCSRSSVLTPSRSPCSTSSRLTQSNNVCGVPANHGSNRFDCRPHRRVFAALFAHQVHSPLTHFRGKLAWLLVHGTILSNVGASTKSGAVHFAIITSTFALYFPRT